MRLSKIILNIYIFSIVNKLDILKMHSRKVSMENDYQHLATNGLTELIAEYEDVFTLRKCGQENPTSWMEVLQPIAFEYKAVRHISTGFSQFNSSLNIAGERQPKTPGSKKLQLLWKGPYKIVARMGLETFKIEDDLQQKFDNENFFCTLLLPKHARNAAFVIRAFNIEISQNLPDRYKPCITVVHHSPTSCTDNPYIILPPESPHITLKIYEEAWIEGRGCAEKKPVAQKNKIGRPCMGLRQNSRNSLNHASIKELGMARLLFWKQFLDCCDETSIFYTPVTSGLAKVIKKYNLSKLWLKNMIAAREKYFGDKPFPTCEALEEYGDKAISSSYYLLLQILGHHSISCDHVASHVGKAQSICNLIRGIPYNASKGRVAIPLDILASNSVSQEDFIRGIQSESTENVIYHLANLANQHIETARSLKNDIPDEARLCFLPIVSADAYLQRLQKKKFNVFDPRLQRKSRLLPLTLIRQRIFKNY
ncbi:NADH dehydrogenase (ubiquinone) complex I, assembly factor 6 [Nymphon striatum]|nr:NADH dehydrogenase (ubiquinone) complex I, assembly factor 6 [Nymphon striatum]